MIKRIRLDYTSRYRPGIPVIVCDKDGKIIYAREGMRSSGGKALLSSDKRSKGEAGSRKAEA